MALIIPFEISEVKLFKADVSNIRYDYKEYNLDALYKNYSAALYGIIFRIVKYDEVAEDALQDTFIKIWKNIESYDSEKGRLFTWMANLAKNTAIDYVRNKSYVNYAATDEISSVSAHKLDKHKISFNIDAIGLEKLISTLSLEQKEMIKLFYYSGYTQVEIAERLEIPLGTVKTKLRQAIIKLRSFFREKG